MFAPRILIADDEQHIVQVLSLTLGRAGYDIDTATDGDTAWTSIQRSRPDLLITDQLMPGLTGRELAKRIHDLPGHKPIPVLMVSGRESVTNTQTGGAVSAVLPKPFSPRQVLAHVQELVGPPRNEEETTR